MNVINFSSGWGKDLSDYEEALRNKQTTWEVHCMLMHFISKIAENKSIESKFRERACKILLEQSEVRRAVSSVYETVPISDRKRVVG